MKAEKERYKNVEEIQRRQGLKLHVDFDPARPKAGQLYCLVRGGGDDRWVYYNSSMKTLDETCAWALHMAEENTAVVRSEPLPEGMLSAKTIALRLLTALKKPMSARKAVAAAGLEYEDRIKDIIRILHRAGKISVVEIKGHKRLVSK